MDQQRVESFLTKHFDKTKKLPNGCWIYPTLTRPRLFICGHHHNLARIIYHLLHRNESLKDKIIRHSCDNPLCINPDHLISGTHQDNMSDKRRVQFIGDAVLLSGSAWGAARGQIVTIKEWQDVLIEMNSFSKFQQLQILNETDELLAIHEFLTNGV